jgi:hypothetical protein
MRLKAKALVARAEAMVRAIVAKAPAKASWAELWNLGELPLGGSIRLWADDGPSTVAQQAKAVEEEDTQTVLGGLYQHRNIPRMYHNRTVPGGLYQHRNIPRMYHNRQRVEL